MLRWVVAGEHNPDIARRTGLSPKTVETCRALLMRKLDAHNTAQLVDQAHRRGLLPVLAGPR